MGMCGNIGMVELSVTSRMVGHGGYNVKDVRIVSVMVRWVVV